MTPYERAQKAREQAVHKYLSYCDELTAQGDTLYDLDPDGAYSRWLDAMQCLDAAKIAAQGLELTNKEQT